LASLHVVPFVATGFEQTPVDWLHVPAVWHWSCAAHVTAVPVQAPLWQASAVVHAFPSLHVVPLALVGFEQTPVDGLHVPAVWHWSCAVHVTGFPVQVPLWQESAVVQALPSLHVVPFGAFPSAGQVVLVPVHASATSQTPVDARQTVPGFPAGCWQRTLLPSHWSLVQTFESSVQAVPLAFLMSAGQLAAVPLQVSAISHSPPAARQTVDVGAKPSAGQVVLVPVQVSATSQAPADARQTVPAFPTGCWQVTAVPSHLSWVQALPSSVQAVPLVFLLSAGQLAEEPVQVSAASHSPAAARQTVVEGASASDGQVRAVPLHVSATSQAPAAARQTVPVVSAVHVPRWPARLHAPQVPAQAVLQQMPLEQKPDEHWLLVVHPSPKDAS
jgi:hypothetical protein